MMQTLEVLQLNDRVVWVWSKSLAVPFLRRICEFHMVTLCIIVQWQEVEQFTNKSFAGTEWFLS